MTDNETQQPHYGKHSASPVMKDRTPPSLTKDQIAQRIVDIQKVIGAIYDNQRIDVPNTPLRPGMGGTISPNEGQLLRNLIREYKPKRTVEIGMGSGLSGLHLCWGLLEEGGGYHTAIDPYQHGRDWQCCALGVRDAANCGDMFDWICEPSDQALPMMVRENEKVEFVFIDGSHRFEAALMDFYYTDQLLPVGGIVAFDDADWPAVRRAVNFALRHRDYKIVNVSKVELGPLTRPWGWKQRMSRRKRYKEFGWPANEANRPAPCETIVLQKMGEDDRHWRFWETLEG